MDGVPITTIATYRCGFPEKFGLPRQSGIVPSIRGQIVFMPEYSAREAFRGLEGFSHIWLIWQFSESANKKWHPTVRPPRLGGNMRKGVFATRSPFRPSPIGLSCVKLERIEFTDGIAILHVLGGDLMDGTPIFDIKPYLPIADCRTEATGGLQNAPIGALLDVEIPEHLLSLIPEADRNTIIAILAEDPRPAYVDNPAREFGFTYNEFEIKFKVNEKKLSVCTIEKK